MSSMFNRISRLARSPQGQSTMRRVMARIGGGGGGAKGGRRAGRARSRRRRY